MMTPMQNQFRNYPQGPQRSPHTSSSRRGPGPMVGAPHLQQAPITQAQMIAQRNAAAIESDLAKRRSRKPTDKNMPEGVEDIIIGDGVQQYKQLRDLERKLDAIMMRKRLDMQESTQTGQKKHKKMRIWISNTADNQPWQGRSLDDNAFDFDTGVEATYRVKIEGRLLDDEEDLENATKADTDDGKTEDTSDQNGEAKSQSGRTPTSRPRAKFSHHFKSITVDFSRDKNIPPDSMAPIEWKKPSTSSSTSALPAAADFDSLEFERKSDENINCTINLFRDETPERYLLSPTLSEILDTDIDDRASVIIGLWDYIKAMNLQQDEEKRMIQCDSRLRALCNSETLYFPTINDYLPPHLSPVPPLSLPYTIRVDPGTHTPTIYDITLPIPSTLPTLINSLLHSPTLTPFLRSIATLDDHLALLIQAIAHSKAKHAFFTSMAKDPQGLVKRWCSSQKRDMEVLLGEAGRGAEEGMAEEWRKGGREGVWGTEGVREAVGLMVAKGGR